MLVKKIYGQQKLYSKTLDPHLRESAPILILNVGLEISPVTIVRNDAQLILLGEMALKSIYVGMPYISHHIRFIQFIYQFSWIAI